MAQIKLRKVAKKKTSTSARKKTASDELYNAKRRAERLAKRLEKQAATATGYTIRVT